MAKRINPDEYIGKKYGRLTVVEYLGVFNGRSKFLCRCDCGSERVVRANNLKTGNTTSCGCLHIQRNIERLTKHGGTRENPKLYYVWAAMLQRCHNAKNKWYANYGGRGIVVCEEWRTSYESFREWAFNSGYVENLTIDRIDVNGNYEPSNCQWATKKEQVRNRRVTRFLTFKDKTLPVAEWAERAGLPYRTLHTRINKGWSIERALTTPVKRQQRKSS